MARDTASVWRGGSAVVGAARGADRADRLAVGLLARAARVGFAGAFSADNFACECAAAAG